MSLSALCHRQPLVLQHDRPCIAHSLVRLKPRRGPQRVRFQPSANSEGHPPHDPQPPPHSALGELLASQQSDELLRAAHHLLSEGQCRVANYCSTFFLYDPRDTSAGAAVPPPPPAADRCWHVYRSLQQASRQAEAAAGAELVTQGRPGAAVQRMEVLEDLVRQLEYCSAEDMYRTLAANEKLLRELAQQAGPYGPPSSLESAELEAAVAAQLATPFEPVAGEGASPAPSQPSYKAAAAERAAGAAHTETQAGAGGAVEQAPVLCGLSRTESLVVFNALDRSRRGWLDRDDLMAGLDRLGRHLDPSDVEQLFMELEVAGMGQGRIDQQTFCDIVEAERMAVPGSDATFLRHLPHARPDWWSEHPHFMDV